MQVLARHEIDQLVVDAFEADRLVLEDSRHAHRRLVDVVEADDGSTRCWRARHQIELACRMVTQVPSVPTSARATLKPFSGSSSSRFS